MTTNLGLYPEPHLSIEELRDEIRRGAREGYFEIMLLYYVEKTKPRIATGSEEVRRFEMRFLELARELLNLMKGSKNEQEAVRSREIAMLALLIGDALAKSDASLELFPSVELAEKIRAGGRKGAEARPKQDKSQLLSWAAAQLATGVAPRNLASRAKRERVSALTVRQIRTVLQDKSLVPTRRKKRK